jgi:hypothetical protein
MKIVSGFLKWTHGRLGVWGTLLLMAPCLWYMWQARQFVAWSLLSALRGHLPRDVTYRTLFMITFMTALAVPYVACLRWLCDRKNRTTYWMYYVFVLLLGFSLLAMLSWPTRVLIEYIRSMGFTPRRLAGLVYAVSAGIFVCAFLRWALRPPEGSEKRWSPVKAAASCCSAVCHFMARAFSLWVAGKPDGATTRSLAAGIISLSSIVVMAACTVVAGEFHRGLDAAWDVALDLLHIRPL